ncbi:unnamed protein product [Anisakis simplex]|uniref:Organ specific protein n=1 Tax=Anisakis simplex TaxID=6269 RepID=A0A0M3J4W2_ANISI|nr:unnamed protein product [Anisakis simplex]
MLINHHCYSLALVLLPIALADNLVLYFPVNPSVPVPESQQDFDQNAPPRVLSRDPDMPSTGIVFIKKTAKHSAPTQFTGDWKGEPFIEKVGTNERAFQIVTAKQVQPKIQFEELVPFSSQIDQKHVDASPRRRENPNDAEGDEIDYSVYDTVDDDRLNNASLH